MNVIHQGLLMIFMGSPFGFLNELDQKPIDPSLWNRE